MRSLRYVIPFLLFLVFAGFLLLGLDRNPSEIPSPLIGKAAPDWSLPRLDPATMPATRQEGQSNPAARASPSTQASQEEPASQLDGTVLKGAPYLLNVWASWCAPCLQEHPLLVDLARRKVVKIVGINYKDTPHDARNWLARHGNPFAVIAADREGRTAIDFGVYGVPETFLVDAQGVIRFKHIGALTPEVVRSKLLPALAALPVAATAQTTPVTAATVTGARAR